MFLRFIECPRGFCAGFSIPYGIKYVICHNTQVEFASERIGNYFLTSVSLQSVILDLVENSSTKVSREDLLQRGIDAGDMHNVCFGMSCYIGVSFRDELCVNLAVPVSYLLEEDVSLETRSSDWFKSG